MVGKMVGRESGPARKRDGGRGSDCCCLKAKVRARPELEKRRAGEKAKGVSVR